MYIYIYSQVFMVAKPEQEKSCEVKSGNTVREVVANDLNHFIWR